MTFITRDEPHDGAKQRGKSLSTPSRPEGYALSPRVNTSVWMLAALSLTRMLSIILPVASSPLVPQTAMSPAPISIVAPGSSTSFFAEPGGDGVAFSSREHADVAHNNANAQTGTSSERKADAGGDAFVALIGEEDVQALSGIEETDPETGAGGSMPSAWRVAVQVNPTGIREPDRSDIERHNER